MSTTEIKKNDPVAQQNEAEAHTWRRPRYDVSENDEAFAVRVAVPGVNRSGVDISVDGDLLSVTASRASKAPDSWRQLRREIGESDYRLNLRLNVPVDENKISATVKDGVLNLNLPKADQVKPRKIEVK